MAQKKLRDSAADTKTNGVSENQTSIPSATSIPTAVTDITPNSTPTTKTPPQQKGPAPPVPSDASPLVIKQTTETVITSVPPTSSAASGTDGPVDTKAVKAAMISSALNSVSNTRANESPSPTSILSNSLSNSPSPRMTTTTRVVFSGVSPLPKGGAVPNPVTSTPLSSSKGHVTFSAHVTEIAENGVKDQSKKIPPPPPPRRSSRPGGFSSPQLGRRSNSPPAYENIDNFSKGDNMQRESRGPRGPLCMAAAERLHQRSRSEPAKSTGMRVTLPPTTQILAQQSNDVAALYAVPSTCKAVQAPKTEEPLTNGKASDSDSTTSSIDSQSLHPDIQMNGKVKMRDGKKVPPPPPVRRTSTLSTQSSNTSSQSSSPGATDDSTDKRKSVAELQQHFINEANCEAPLIINGNPLAKTNGNGNVVGPDGTVQTLVTKLQTGVKANGTGPQKGIPNKNYAETEIF